MLKGKINPSKMDRTENGALTFSTSGNGLVDLYFQLIDGTDHLRMVELLEAARREDLRGCLVLLFDLRNCRGGKGRYNLFARAINHMLPYEGVVDQLQHIPHYGSFKDFWRLGSLVSDESVNQKIVDLYSTQLALDCVKAFGMTPSEYNTTVRSGARPAFKVGATVSLAAKYAPKDNRGMGFFFVGVRKALKMTEKAYRWMCADLRKNLHIVEVPMSASQWEAIDYSKVHSVALKRYLKAFKKHDESRVGAFFESVKKGEAKANVGQVYPYQFVNAIRLGQQAEENSILFDEYLRQNGEAFGNAVVICDTSGSMMSGFPAPLNGSPLDIAISLTLLIAWNTTGRFERSFIEFSDRSSVVPIRGETWSERIRNLSTAAWGQSTNVQAAFDRLLETPEDVEIVLCISDMQFNICGERDTNFEVIDAKFKAANRKRPTFVFWNVSPLCKDSPVKCTQEGVVLVSGFSPAICKLIFENGGRISPLSFVKSIIDHPMYSRITLNENDA